MKRFATEMMREEFLILINLLKKAGAYDDFKHNILMKCDICGSFIIDIDSVIKAIGKIESKLPYEQIEEENIDIFISEFESSIKEPITLTEEDWVEFGKGALKIPFVYIFGGILADDNGNPIQFIVKECSFVFNSECVCNPIMEGIL